MATPIPQNRAPFSLFELLAATGGRLRAGSEDVRTVGLTSDSREVAAGSAFIALRGESGDGHDFLQSAHDRGAALLIVKRGRTAPAGATVVEVDDTLGALGLVAAAHIRRWRRERHGLDRSYVVAITGSAGKTTTKELLRALLGTVDRCLATQGNLNNRIGLPATALCLTSEHRFAVLEAGMSVPGEMAELGRIANPNVAVLTNIGLAHAQGLGGTRADVAREKGELFAALGADGVAVANADDDAVLGQLVRSPAKRALTFGKSERAQYRLLARTARGADGSQLTVGRPCGSRGSPRARETVEVFLPIVGEAAAMDFLAALAAAEACAGPIGATALASAMTALPELDGRARVLRLGGDVLLLDDSYNANPASMRAALATARELAADRSRRVVVVLGEMRELGPVAEREHDVLGSELASFGVRVAIGCGGLVDRCLVRARNGGVETESAADSDQAARIAAELVRSGDVVLVKASRSVRAELVVRALVEQRGPATEERGA